MNKEDRSLFCNLCLVVAAITFSGVVGIYLAVKTIILIGDLLRFLVPMVPLLK